MLLQIAARNLRQAGRRTTFLALAVLLVTALLVVLLALSQGLTDSLIRSATTLGTGHINVAGFYKVSQGDVAPLVTSAAEIRKIVEENTPDLAYVVDRQRGFGSLVAENGTSVQSGILGVNLAAEPRLANQLKLAPRSDYLEGGGPELDGSLDKLNEPRSMVLFAGQAKRLGVRVGDPLTLTAVTARGGNNTVDVTIVAVAKDVGLLSSFNTFVPKDTLRELYNLKEDTTGAVMVYLNDITKAGATMAHLRKVLEEKGHRVMEHQSETFWMKFEVVAGEDWTGQKLDLTVWEDEVGFLTWIITAFDTVSFFLIGILVLIIGIGIMNTMWIAVRERTREVGTLRAIGMSKRRVLAMFLFEALLLGLFATSIGAAIGAAGAYALDAAAYEIPIDAFRFIFMGDTLHLSLRADQVIYAVITLTFVTALSALWPAMRASRLQPVTAIQHVG